MEKYGEYLFDAYSSDIAECIDILDVQEIESCCEYKIYTRAYDYFMDGMVEYVDLSVKANTINGTVHGSQEYKVEIYINDDEVHGSCTCPYGAVCKHMVALLLYIVDDGIENVPINITDQTPVIKSLDFLKTHLQQLPKDELINLVMKFAPENFVQKVFNNKSNKEDSVKVFAKVNKKIQGFFENDELLWDPSGMESALMGQLNKLQGLEKSISEQIGKLILKIMIEINNAFDGGYLYIDNYYEDDYFESQEFNHYVISFTKQLTFNQKLDFIQELDFTLRQMSYNTFEAIPKKYSPCFTKEDSKKLSKYVISKFESMSISLISDVYDIIENNLSKNEKEQVLIRLSNSGSHHHLITLVELLSDQKRQKDAFDHLEKFISGKKYFIENKAIILYLDLASGLDLNINRIAFTALNHNAEEIILSKIKTLGIKDLTPYEKVIRDKAPEELLRFYEKEKRLTDALQLISDTKKFPDYTIFTFFKKNKKNLTDQAEQYFMSRIAANLVNAGEKYYVIIAETIAQIKQINTRLANEIVEDIQIKYKRRTKLMSMLRRFS